MCPCKDCTERHFKCHSECGKYKAFTDELEQIRENRRRDAEFTCYLVDKQTQKERYFKKRKAYRKR